MKSEIKKSLSFVAVLALVFGSASCSTDGSEQRARGLKPSFTSEGVIVPSGYENGNINWHYSFEELGYNNFSAPQVLEYQNRIILVGKLAGDAQNKVVVINADDGSVIAEFIDDIIGKWTPARISKNKAGIPYLSMIQVGPWENKDPLKKTGHQARIVYVDFMSDMPKLESGSVELVDATEASMKLEGESSSDIYKGQAVVESRLSSGLCQNTVVSGNEAYGLAEPTECYQGDRIVGVRNGRLITAQIENGFSLDLVYENAKSGKKISIGDLTGKNAYNLVFNEEQYAMFVEGSYKGITTLVDMDKDEVVFMRKHPNGYVSDGEERNSFDSYDISDNGRYMVHGTLLIDLGKKKVIDKMESADSLGIYFDHVSDDGVAYGKSKNETISVTYDMKSDSIETSVGAEGDQFGKVVKSEGDGTLTIKSNYDIFSVSRKS